MKNLIVVFVFSLLLMSCGEKNEATIGNEKLVQQYFDHFNKHEWKQMAAMYSESAEFKDPSLGPGIVKQTHEQISKKYGELGQTFPDVHDQVLNLYPSGDKHIIVEFISSGTAPDSSKFELPICTIFKIENGQITQDFTYFDNFEEQ